VGERGGEGEREGEEGGLEGLEEGLGGDVVNLGLIEDMLEEFAMLCGAVTSQSEKKCSISSLIVAKRTTQQVIRYSQSHHPFLSI